MKNLINFIEEEIDESSWCSKDFKKGNSCYDAIKCARKKSREEEIEQYGKPLNHNKVFKSKKHYSRKSKHKDKY